MQSFKVYVKSILVPVVIGIAIGLIISNYIDYNSLIKPCLSLPAIVFPIVWIILYILMGISYGILKDNYILDDKANFIYYIQLFFNATWSVIFFVLKARLFAFFWIVILTILVIIMTINFYQKDRTAGLLQIPYILWCLFATYLNLGIYLLNR